MALTQKQQRFVEAFCTEANGTKAAIAAGYAEKSAAVEASRLLSNAKVASAIDARRAELAATTAVTPERVLEELARIGFSDIRQVVAWQANGVSVVEDDEGEPRLAVTHAVSLKDSESLSEAVAAGILEIQQSASGALKIKMHPKLPALVKLGEHLGLFRPEHAPRGAGRKGKKEAAQDAAQSAGEGTDWGDDLRLN